MKWALASAFLLAACAPDEDSNFRRDRVVYKICFDGTRIYYWDERYWTYVHGWRETNKDVC